MAEQFANHSGTTLAAAITTVDRPVTFTLASNAGLPTQPQFRLKIDSELLLVSAVNSDGSYTASTAEGTTAATHNAGASVDHILTAGALAQFQQDTEDDMELPDPLPVTWSSALPVTDSASETSLATLAGAVSSGKLIVTDTASETSLATLAGAVSSGKLIVTDTAAEASLSQLASLVSSGKLLVSDSVLDAIISNSKLSVTDAAAESSLASLTALITSGKLSVTDSVLDAIIASGKLSVTDAAAEASLATLAATVSSGKVLVSDATIEALINNGRIPVTQLAANKALRIPISGTAWTNATANTFFSAPSGQFYVVYGIEVLVESAAFGLNSSGTPTAGDLPFLFTDSSSATTYIWTADMWLPAASEILSGPRQALMIHTPPGFCYQAPSAGTTFQWAAYAASIVNSAGGSIVCTVWYRLFPSLLS